MTLESVSRFTNLTFFEKASDLVKRFCEERKHLRKDANKHPRLICWICSKLPIKTVE